MFLTTAPAGEWTSEIAGIPVGSYAQGRSQIEPNTALYRGADGWYLVTLGGGWPRQCGWIDGSRMSRMAEHGVRVVTLVTR